MPKLPHVSGAEVVCALERMGFAVVRQRGSQNHHAPGPFGLRGANHLEIKTGTLAGTLRQAGVSAEEFIAGL